MAEQLYDIYRFFFPATAGNTFEVIKTKLTKAEADAYMAQPDRYSWATTSVRAKLYTRRVGKEWCDTIMKSL